MNIFELFGTIAIKNKDANEALKDTAQKAERTGKQIQEAFKKVGSATVKVGKTVGTAVTAVATAWGATIEKTREYRTAMAQLDTAFTTSGHTAETATNTYKGLQAVMGDTNAAVEAASALALMCEEEEDLAKWVDICTGAWAVHQGKLPIEGLAEAANETANVGVVTGNLADALNWVGISEDDFNLKLRACRTEQERQKLILNTLYPMYKAQADQYKENADSVMKANEANDNLTRAMSRLGAVGEPIMTKMKNWIADMINASVPHLETLITKFGEIDSVWNDVIWPLVQSTFKVAFDVDVPEWSEIETQVTAWWTETAKPEIEKITKAFMNIGLPDLGALASTFQMDWGTLVAPTLLSLLTGNYLHIVPVIGTALAGLITSNWDTHIKPVLDGFLNQGLDIKVPDVAGWTTILNDIKSGWDTNVAPGLKELFTNLGGSLSEALGTGGETLAIVLTGVKDFGTWCADNTNTISDFFATMGGEAAEGMTNAGQLLTVAADAIKGITAVGVETVTGALQWTLEHGEAVAIALEAMSVGLAMAAIAAHPYAAAITAAAAALGLMKEYGGEDRYDHFFGDYSEEELAKLQEYVDAAKELEAAQQAVYDALDRGEDAIPEDDAVNTARANLEAIKAQIDEGLLGIYNSWNTGQDGYTSGMYFDVPVRVAEGSETEVQNEVSSMNLSANVKLYPDYSAMNSVSGYFGGGSTRRVALSKAGGMDEVPYDGFYAHLHKGEAVLNKVEADAWRGGNTSAIEAKLDQLIAVMSNSRPVVLDSGAVVGQLAPAMDARLGTISNRKGRRN